MTNLFQYLTQDFDEEDMTWSDADDITLDLELQQRLDFNATLLAIARERQVQRECEAMWQQHEANPDGD